MANSRSQQRIRYAWLSITRLLDRANGTRTLLRLCVSTSVQTCREMCVTTSVRTCALRVRKLLPRQVMHALEPERNLNRDLKMSIILADTDRSTIPISTDGQRCRPVMWLHHNHVGHTGHTCNSTIGWAIPRWTITMSAITNRENGANKIKINRENGVSTSCRRRTSCCTSRTCPMTTPFNPNHKR